MAVVTLITSEAIDLWRAEIMGGAWPLDPSAPPVDPLTQIRNISLLHNYLIHTHTHTHTHTSMWLLRASAHNILHILSISRCCVYPVTGFIPWSELLHKKQLLTRTLQLDPNLETLCLMKVSSLLVYCHLRQLPCSVSYALHACIIYTIDNDCITSCIRCVLMYIHPGT